MAGCFGAQIEVGTNSKKDEGAISFMACLTTAMWRQSPDLCNLTGCVPNLKLHVCLPLFTFYEF